MTDWERSHAELRAAVRIAAQVLQRRPILDRAEKDALAFLRRVYRDARAIARVAAQPDHSPVAERAAAQTAAPPSSSRSRSCADPQS